MRSKEKIFSFVLMFKHAGSISGFGIYKCILHPFKRLRMDSVASSFTDLAIPANIAKKWIFH